MSTVKIKNNRRSLVTLPAIKGTSFGPVGLKPGVNEVSEEYIEALSTKKGIDDVFDPKKGGYLELVDKGEPLIAPDAKVTLAGMNVPDSIVMIESCTDVAQLDQWNKMDTRKGVHDAIAKRAAELAKRAEEDAATTSGGVGPGADQQ